MQRAGQIEIWPLDAQGIKRDHYVRASICIYIVRSKRRMRSMTCKLPSQICQQMILLLGSSVLIVPYRFARCSFNFAPLGDAFLRFGSSSWVPLGSLWNTRDHKKILKGSPRPSKGAPRETKGALRQFQEGAKTHPKRANGVQAGTRRAQASHLPNFLDTSGMLFGACGWKVGSLRNMRRHKQIACLSPLLKPL